MKVLSRRSDIVINNRKMRVGDLISKLKNLPSKEVKDFFTRQRKVLPRSVRCEVLRVVLDEQIKNPKVTASFSDELNYRLNWYNEFSEYQLECLLAVLDNKSLVELYKEELWLAILQIHEDLGIDNLSIFTVYNKSISYDLDGGGNENIQEYNRNLDEIFFDARGEIDGLKVDDFRRVLNSSSTLVELRELGTKYGIDVPRRIKKTELLDIILDELTSNGDLTKELEERLKKMPVMSLQRFAKDNKIKASIELKKEDIIEYIISHMDVESVDSTVGLGENVQPILQAEEPVAPMPEADNPFDDLDVDSIFSSSEPQPKQSEEAPAPEEIFVDPSIFDVVPEKVEVETNPSAEHALSSDPIIAPESVSVPEPVVTEPVIEPEPIIDMPFAEEQNQEETILEFESVAEEPLPEDTFIPQFESDEEMPATIDVDESMFGTPNEDIKNEEKASSEEIESLKAQIGAFNQRLADLIEKQNQLLEKVVNKEENNTISEPINIFEELKAQKEEVELVSEPTEEPLEDSNIEPVIEEEPVKELTGVEALIAEAQKEVEIPLTKREIKMQKKQEKLQKKLEEKEEQTRLNAIKGEELTKSRQNNTLAKAEYKALKASIKNSSPRRKGIFKTIFKYIFILLLIFIVLVGIAIVYWQLYNNATVNGNSIIPQEGVFAQIYDFIDSIWINVKNWFDGIVNSVKEMFNFDTPQETVTTTGTGENS